MVNENRFIIVSLLICFLAILLSLVNAFGSESPAKIGDPIKSLLLGLHEEGDAAVSICPDNRTVFIIAGYSNKQHKQRAIAFYLTSRDGGRTVESWLAIVIPISDNERSEGAYLDDTGAGYITRFVSWLGLGEGLCQVWNATPGVTAPNPFILPEQLLDGTLFA